MWLLLLAALAAAPASGQSVFEDRTVVAITVEGLKHIREDVVQKQIATKVGAVFHQSVADADVVRLDKLGVFSEIHIEPEPGPEGVTVRIKVVETLRVLPAMALSITDANGASAGPAVKLLSVRGEPHAISVTSEFGGQTKFSISEESPYLTYDRLWHTTKLEYRDRTNTLEDFQQRELTLDARIGRRHTEHWRTGAMFQINHVEAVENGFTLSPSNSDTFYSVGAMSELDRRNQWTMPTRGWWNSSDVLFRFGTDEYVTVDLDVRRYQPIAERQTVLATSLLTLQSGTVGVSFPGYYRLALGGENSVRGWSANVRSGKNQFINSLEYRYTLLPTRSFTVAGINLYCGLAIAAFGDLGAVWDDSDQFSNSFIGGGGIGLRIYVPFVNMLRLDFAIGDGSWHTALGVNEKAVAQRLPVR